jgi:hypothetical protein
MRAQRRYLTAKSRRTVTTSDKLPQWAGVVDGNHVPVYNVNRNVGELPHPGE